MGDVYPGSGFVQAEVRSTEPCHGWCLDDIAFTAAGGAVIPAYFLRPPEGHAPVPALIYAHAHGNRYYFGRKELVEGRSSLQGAYAPDLVRSGVAALCLDMPCFGGRQTPDESTLAKALLWQGQTLFGQMLAELQAGVDYLAAHPQVRPDRIGAFGFSMGSTQAWWLAALDPRVRAAVALCSFADLETLVALGGHDGHGQYMTVPGLLPLARSGQIAGLAAPRSLMVAVGLQDWSTPKPAFDTGLRDLEAAYAALDARENLHLHVEPDVGHIETPAMRAAVLDFLRKSL